MAIDPGYRTGCKVVCLDEQGNILHNETIFPHPPQEDRKTAAKKIAPKIKKIYTDFQGTTVDPTLLKNTGYARKVDLDKAIKNRKKSTGSN